MKIINFLLLLLFCISNSDINAQEEKIGLYSMYTDSHRILLNEWFSPSLKNLKGEFDVRITKFLQECPTGVEGKEGFHITMRRKVEMIIQAIKETMGSWFVYSDVDIQFFAPIKKDLFQRLADVDIVIQKDSPKGVLCAGFFACKSNKWTLALFQEILSIMLKNPNFHDQKVLNFILHRSKNKIHWKTLPPIYFGGGTLTGTGWKPGNSLPVPKEIKMHHANWTRGTKNKIAQLKYVKDVVESRTNINDESILE
jgi:hypothetical protein